MSRTWQVEVRLRNNSRVVNVEKTVTAASYREALAAIIGVVLDPDRSVTGIKVQEQLSDPETLAAGEQAAPESVRWDGGEP